MADKSRAHMQGLIVHDSRFSMDTLNAKGAGATDAAYTERNPRQGVPKPSGDESMTLAASGSQSGGGSLTLACQRAGIPVAGGASYTVQDKGAGDSTSEQYGHDGWQAVTGYESLINSDGVATTTSEPIPHAITLASGKVLAIVDFQAPGTLDRLRFYVYDPDDGTGGFTSITHTLGHSTHQKGMGLVQLPNGDCLCFTTAIGGTQVDVLRSTDEGATWAVAAERVLDAEIGNNDIRRIAVAYSAGQILMLVSYHTGSAFEASQYASFDNGASFELVDAAFSATSASGDEVASPSIVTRATGGFVVGWADTKTSSPFYQTTTVGSATTLIAAQTHLGTYTGSAGDEPGFGLFETDLGEVWHIAHGGTANRGDITVARSVDAGGTFSSFATAINFETQSTAGLYHYTAAQCGGRVLVIGRFKGSGNSYADASVVCVYLGGYSRHTLPAADDADGFGPEDFLAWGTNSSDCPAWLPFTEPDNLAGWALTSSGTSAYTDDSTSGNITTTTGTRYYSFDWDRTEEQLICEFACSVTAGGSTSTDAIAARLTISDGTSGGAGTYTYIVHVRMTTIGWVLYDVNAAANVGDAVSKSLTSKIHFRVALDDSGNARAWYAADGYLREWVQFASGTGLTNSAAAHGNEFQIGSRASSTTDSDWYFAAVSRNGTGKYGPASSVSIASSWTNPGDLRGKGFTTLPHLLWDGVRVAAQGGPAWQGDSWSIAAEYGSPVDNLLTNEAPSPSEPWESTADNVEVLFSFDIEPDFTNAQSLCANFAAMVHNSNIREFQIQAYNGSTWSTLATAYAYTDFDALAYVRTGRVVGVDTGTTQTGARYFLRAAHEGDTFDFQDGTPTLRKIHRNSGGAWTDSTASRPEVVIEGADGTEPSSGTGRVWRRDFGIIYAAASGTTQQIRIRIPPHKTADGNYRIGALIMGPLVLFGRPVDHGHSWSITRNTRMSERRDGVRRVQEQGAMRRAVEFAWADAAVDLSQIMKDDPVPDWVGNNGAAVASADDTTRDVMGAFYELGGNLHPCVYLARIDDISGGGSTQALTMPGAYLYGRIVSESLRVENVLGTESKSELERLNRITIEEEL